VIRVLLVDDHAVVRVGFKLLLQTAADVTVVAEADSGEAACQIYGDVSPDIVILDISMPGMGGLEALRRLRLRYGNARVLALSAHDDVMHAQRALKQGALGFLSKRSAPEVLLGAVRAVADGQRYVDAKLADELNAAGADGEESPVSRLSEREIDVFLSLARWSASQRN
jgi:two-component system invasion response regulator UvrY